MTERERQDLIEAVQAALVPFKRELKEELIDPLRQELKADIAQANEQLRQEFAQANEQVRREFRGEMELLHQEIAQTNERLDAEIQDLVEDVLHPLMNALEADHQRLLRRVERLEQRVEDLSWRMERRMTALEDELAEIRSILRNMQEEMVTRKAIEGLEQRVSRLEAAVFA